MTKTIELDVNLLRRLRRVTRCGSDVEALTAAAREYIELREPTGAHAGLIKLFGQVEFHPDWDPRKMRGK